jgi:putative Mn2+ efflux pump MntP
MLGLLLLSVALAMDAFAVSLVRGAGGGRHAWAAIEVGLAFGLAQALMPLLGWALGRAFAGTIEAFDHWIAFALLSILGLRMLRASLGEDEPPVPSRRSHLVGLGASAIATSIDAAAAGITLPALGVGITTACITIGVTTAIVCTLGFLMASKVSANLGKRAELFGGLVLIGLGVRILFDHLGA